MPMPGSEIVLVGNKKEDADRTFDALQQENLASHIQVARDGEEALEYLFCRGEFADRPQDHLPGLVLVDLDLPKVDGITVLKQIKADPRTKIIPVVILTSPNSENHSSDVHDLGANSYVEKPIDIDQLCAKVKQIGRYWMITNQSPIVNNMKRAAKQGQ